MAILQFNKGDVIFREGDEDSSFFHILSGKVGIFANFGTENEVKLTEEEAGQYFGEMAAVSGYRRSATVIAAEDNTVVEEIPETELDRFLEENPSEIIQVMRQTSRRIRELTKDCNEVKDAVNALKAGSSQKQDESLLTKIRKFLSSNKEAQSVEELRQADHSKGYTTENVKSYPAGTIIFKEGDPANCMYDIHFGRVGIYTGYGTPDEKKLTELFSNKFFGEMGMIDSEPRSATAVVLDDETTLETIYTPDLIELMKENPPKVAMIMEHLTNRLRNLTADYTKACEELNRLSE